MGRKKPVPGSFYRHFKGNIYQIRDLAKHTETGEEMVVYQAMYPPFSIWARPLEMFLEPVDRQQYPDAGQQFRFEEVRLVSRPEQAAKGQQQQSMQRASGQQSPTGLPASQGEVGRSTGQAVSEADLRSALIEGQVETKLAGRMSGEEIARRGFLALLDAKDFRDKRRILQGLQPYLNGLYINNLAAALDIVLEEGTDQQHYDTILHCLETLEKYEGGRLRP